MLVELVYTHDLKLCALLLKRSNRLRRNFFSLMELFNFFNTFSFFHIAISIFAFYILCSLFYNVLFSASEDFTQISSTPSADIMMQLCPNCRTLQTIPPSQRHMAGWPDFSRNCAKICNIWQ